ncbi:hypothetical protein EI613_13645 [Azospirillum sp. 412522]|nr:hypothetical protein [Azospirillum sp. 412522]MBY6262944.1 hypothetical protein [Azospirillum sp. 412522]
MMATQKTDGWTGGCMDGCTADRQPSRAASEPAASGREPEGPECRRTRWQDRESRLVEALLEFTTIAGLFALLFALFVLFGAIQTLTP